MKRTRTSEKETAVSAAVPARHKRATTRRVKGNSSEPALAAAPTQPVPAAPSRQDVARLAYSYWEARGCQEGSPEEDWVRAERALAAAATA